MIQLSYKNGSVPFMGFDPKNLRRFFLMSNNTNTSGGRLKKELYILADALANGRNIGADGELQKFSAWSEALQKQYTFTEENAMEILLQETGKVFAAVLEDAGVYKNDDQGKAAFLTFVDAVNKI